jgi:hypothetical protein
MTEFQQYALTHPLARASGGGQQDFRQISMPWSVILTVNK